MAELRDVSDPAGTLATDAVKALAAWLRDHPGCTHNSEDGRHVLRDDLGILIASNPDLATALATAEAKELAALNDKDHPVTPVEGTATRTKPGFGAAPASLTDRTHYPVEAICQGCGEIVRSEHIRAGWTHTGRKPGDPR